MKLGDMGAAEQQLQSSHEAAPANVKLAGTLAAVKLAEGDVAGAEKVLRQSAEQSPKSADAAIALARLYLLTGNYDQAEREYQRVLTLQPSSEVAMLGLARIQLVRGQKTDAQDTFKRVAGLPDTKNKSIYAEFLLGTGQVAQAIDEFEKLRKQLPDDRAIRSSLVNAYLSADKRQNAVAILAEAIGKNPRDVDALLQRARIAVAAGDYNAAEADISQVLHFRPDAAEAHWILAGVHAGRGQALSQRRDLTEAVRINPRLLAARVELARLLASSKQPKAALEVLDETPKDQKTALPVIIGRNWALMALENTTELRGGIDNGLKVARVRDLLLQDAILRLYEKDYIGARVSAEEIVQRIPDDLAALNVLAGTYVAQKQPAQALAAIERTVARNPGSAKMQYFLGQWLAAAGKASDARKAFTAAKAADPQHFSADLAIARLDLAGGDTAAARKALLAFVEGHPKEASAVQMLGELEESAGNRAAAIVYYRAALELVPENVACLNNLAYLLADFAHQPDAALDYAKRAKALAGDNPTVDDTLGWALYQKGLYREAVEHLERAASGNRSAVINFHLAMVYTKLGNAAKASEALKLAAKLDPNLPELKAMDSQGLRP